MGLAIWVLTIAMGIILLALVPNMLAKKAAPMKELASAPNLLLLAKTAASAREFAHFLEPRPLEMEAALVKNILASGLLTRPLEMEAAMAWTLAFRLMTRPLEMIAAMARKLASSLLTRSLEMIAALARKLANNYLL